MQLDSTVSRIGFLPDFLNDKSIQATSLQADALMKLESSDVDLDLSELIAALDDVNSELDTLRKKDSIRNESSAHELTQVLAELKEEQQALWLLLACVDSWGEKNRLLRSQLYPSPPPFTPPDSNKERDATTVSRHKLRQSLDESTAAHYLVRCCCSVYDLPPPLRHEHC